MSGHARLCSAIVGEELAIAAPEPRRIRLLPRCRPVASALSAGRPAPSRERSTRPVDRTRVRRRAQGIARGHPGRRRRRVRGNAGPGLLPAGGVQAGACGSRSESAAAPAGADAGGSGRGLNVAGVPMIKPRKKRPRRHGNPKRGGRAKEKPRLEASEAVATAEPPRQPKPRVPWFPERGIRIVEAVAFMAAAVGFLATLGKLFTGTPL